MTEETLVANELSSSPPVRRGRSVGMVSMLMILVSGCGYLREATLAARFGLSTTMDAYFAAVFIPTMVYMVLIAGMLSPVFIPILLQDATAGRDELSETFSVVTNLVLVFLAVVVGCAVIAAPKWLPLLFAGFSAPTVEVTLRLIYIIFPSTIFVALAGILSSTLNAFHKFALAAVAPAVSSVTVVAVALFARGNRAIYMVGVATAVGFLLQLLFLVPAIGSLGIRYRLVFSLQHPAVGKLWRMGGPLLLYLLVANASSFLERNLASRLSAGAVSTLTYAYRLFTVPSNFMAAPLAIVAYPQFAREALRTDGGELRSQVSRVFRMVLFIFLPATIWTVLNALPLTRLLYERGQFGLESSILTARVLSFYGIGVLPVAFGSILLPCFYAVQDTITPLWIEVIVLFSYIAMALFLMNHFGLPGLALSRGLAFYLFVAILLFVLHKRRLLKMDADLLRFTTRVGLASLVMAAVSWASLHVLQTAFDSGKMPLRLMVVSAVLILSGSAFLGVARLLNLREVEDIMRAAMDFLPWKGSGSTQATDSE